MNDFLIAFAGYFPWLVLLILAVIFYKPVKGLIEALRNKVEIASNIAIDAIGIKGSITANTKDAQNQAAKAGATFEALGDPDQLKLLFKARGVDYKKSTKALGIPGGGCLVQMTTDRLRRDGSWSTSEALQFVPGVSVLPTGDGKTHMLGLAEQ